MTTAVRVQGLAFCCLAVTVGAAFAVFPGPDLRLEIFAAAMMIGLLGVPHGAFDIMFARTHYRIQTLQRWTWFGLSYLVLAAAVVALWLAAPGLFLISFLAVSVVHFSGDPPAGTSTVSRVIYGGAPVLLPAIWHEQEVFQLFAMLAGDGAALNVLPWMSLVAVPWVVALIAASIFEARTSPRTAFEMLSVGLVVTLPPPLIGFSIFFCGMHSARHILRSVAYGRALGARQLALAGLGPTVLVFAIAAGAWWFLRTASLDARMVQLIFVGLAAVTVPHMVVIERVRFAGWQPLRGVKNLK